VTEPRFLLLDEVAALLRFDVTAAGRPREAAIAWLRSQRVPIIHRSRRVWLVDRAALFAVLET